MNAEIIPGCDARKELLTLAGVKLRLMKTDIVVRESGVQVKKLPSSRSYFKLSSV
mgnify:CR=1 FL=1